MKEDKQGSSPCSAVKMKAKNISNMFWVLTMTTLGYISAMVDQSWGTWFGLLGAVYIITLFYGGVLEW